MEVDVVKQIGAVTREVRQVERDGKLARVVVASRTYATDQRDLWDALTSKERIPRWFLPISGDLELGGRYQFQGNAGGEILECAAPERLSVTWEMMGDVSWVHISLSPKGDDTELTLEHIALVDEERWKQYGPGAVGVGWEGGLLGLELHLSSGEAVDPEASMAWMTSENGKSYYRASSKGWADANIAAGEPEADARAAEAGTSAFYTGETG